MTFWTKYLNIWVKFTKITCFGMLFIICNVCHLFFCTWAFCVQLTCGVQFDINLMFWTEYLNILFQNDKNSYFKFMIMTCHVFHVFSYTWAFCVQLTCGVQFDRNLMFWTEYLNILFQNVKTHISNSWSWLATCFMSMCLHCVILVFLNNARWLLQNILFCSKYLNIWTQNC